MIGLLRLRGASENIPDLSEFCTVGSATPSFTGPYGIPLELPYEEAEPGGPSFVKLVKIYSGDMAPRQMLEELVRSGSMIELEGRYKVVRRNYEPVALSPQLIARLGEIGYRVFSTAAKNIEKKEQGGGNFDRMVFADDGLTERAIEQFDKYIKARGQELLEEIDMWFTANSGDVKPDEDVKSTGLYMVHYVEDESEKMDLRDLLTSKSKQEKN